MYQNDPVKVLTGECRLSYVSVITPRAAQQGGEHHDAGTAEHGKFYEAATFHESSP